MDKFNLDKCIKAISKGDEVALKNLYDNYKNPMFQFALSIVKNAVKYMKMMNISTNSIR